MKRVFLISLVFCGLSFATIFGVFAQDCRQVWIEPNAIPFTFDTNGVPPIVTFFVLDAGKEYIREVLSCDPDGDPYTVSPNSLPEGMTFANDYWTWTPTRAQIGVHFAIFDAIDQPPAPYDPCGITGVYVIQVRRVGNEVPCFIPF